MMPLTLRAQLSFNQARTIIPKLIAGLRNLGVKPGDCVLLHSFNDIYYPMLGLSIIGTGAIFAGTNPAYTKLELAHHIRITQAKWVFSEPELLPNLLEAMKDIGLTEADMKERMRVLNWLPTQNVPAGFKSWKSLFKHGEQDWVRFDDLKTCKTTTALRATSSGTTGLPKATVNTHYNLIAQHELNWSPTYCNKPYEVKHLWPLPMFHLSILPRVFMTVWKVGEIAYIMRRWDTEAFAAGIDRWGITEMHIVPPMAVAMIMSPLVKGTQNSQGKGKYSLRSVKHGLVGAAPLTKETQARLKSLLSQEPMVVFGQAWGMTEANCLVSGFDYPEDDDTGSVGYLRPGTDAKIMDDDGRDISGYNVVGEVCVRGPLNIPGYFSNDKANKESFDSKGFYHSGDVGYCDGKTKKWYLVDRKKELIKVRGFQVAPPEIESVLLMHPNIIDAAVIGVKEEGGLREGEVPRAFVVKRPGSQIGEGEVKEWVRGKLASFKRLDGGVRFIGAIPKNASGKILKRILREQAKKEVDAVAKL